MRKIIMIPLRSGLFSIFFVFCTKRVFNFVLFFFKHTVVFRFFKFSTRKDNLTPKKHFVSN